MARKRKKNKKWIWWMIMAVLFVAAGVIAYFVWDGYFKEKPSVDAGGSDDVSSAETMDEGGSGQVGSSDVLVEKEEVVQYEGEDPNEQDSLTGVVTYAGVSGDSLMIRVNIDQYLAEGSCVMSLVQNGIVVYTNEAGLIDSAATATCEGFNIPVGELGGGDYQIVIELNSGEKSGVIKGEVSV